MYSAVHMTEVDSLGQAFPSPPPKKVEPIRPAHKQEAPSCENQHANGRGPMTTAPPLSDDLSVLHDDDLVYLGVPEVVNLQNTPDMAVRYSATVRRRRKMEQEARSTMPLSGGCETTFAVPV